MQVIDNLRRAWEEHQLVRIPDDSSDPELGWIHADVVLYDDQVAGAVATLLSGAQPRLMMLDTNELLEGTLESIIALHDGREQQAVEYLDYVRRLNRLLRLAKQAG